MGRVSLPFLCSYQNLPCRPTGTLRADDAAPLQFIDEAHGIDVANAHVPLKRGNGCAVCRANHLNGAFVVGIDKRLSATFRAQVKLAAGFYSLLLRHVYLSSVWHLLFPLRFRALHGAFRDSTDAATVARYCPAYDRFTVLWLSFLSLQFPRFEIVVKP